MDADPSTDVIESRNHVLLIDDDLDVGVATGLLLERRGFRMSVAREPSEAWSVLEGRSVRVVLLDLNFTKGATSGDEGLGFLRDVVRLYPNLPVIVVTGHSGLNIAVAAMRVGAKDFLTKPWSNDRLVRILEDTLSDSKNTVSKAAGLQEHTIGHESPEPVSPLLGVSPAILRVREVVRRTAATEAGVLIFGEAGTGKTLIARAIHALSSVSGPFVSVDLSGLSASTTDRVLFGSSEDRGSKGALRRALGGTLFFEELASVDRVAQGAIIEALNDLEAGQEHRGGERGSAKIRLIAATRTCDVSALQKSHLRDDFLAMFNTVEVYAPALRDREGDSLFLANHYLREFALKHSRPPKEFSTEAQHLIQKAAWRGDVRTLIQGVERSLLFSEGASIDVSDLDILTDSACAPTERRSSLREADRVLVVKALNSCNQNVSRAAKELGITRASLYRRMAKYGL